MPLQMILLALLAMVTSDSMAGDAGWLSPVQTTTEILGQLIGGYALLVLVAALLSRRTVRRLHASTAAASTITYRTHQFLDYARWASVALLGAQLWYGDWGRLVWFGWGMGGHANAADNHVMAAELLFITPVLLTFLGFWTCSYYVERAIRERALPFELQMGQPAHPMPGLWAYLLMQACWHNFYILAIIAFKGMINSATFQSAWGHAHETAALIVGGTIMGALMIGMPVMIVNLWHTVPLPDPACRTTRMR